MIFKYNSHFLRNYDDTKGEGADRKKRGEAYELHGCKYTSNAFRKHSRLSGIERKISAARRV